MNTLPRKILKGLEASK